jgi:4-aminobutyrate aminotransferase-like enzyme
MDKETIFARRQSFMSGSLSLSYKDPLMIVRGSGCWLFDENGQAYLDCVNNVCHVGHCHPKIVEAGSRQMTILNTNTRYLHPGRMSYVESLLSTFPAPLSVCFLVCSGSEANDLALRLARAHTGASDAIVLDGAYHGNTTALIELSPYKFDGPGGSGAAKHIHKVEAPDLYRGSLRACDPEAALKYADLVKAALTDAEARQQRVAAFFCESMLGCGGQIVLPDHYLKHAYEHVRRAGALCIADEVQVGFARSGSHFWSFEMGDVVPDIVTLGKPMGNGHPMAAVITTPELASSFANGMEYFNTFGGNPVSCAIGQAVLDVIEQEGLQQRARELGLYLKSGLKSLAARFPLIGDVRGQGLFLGLELVSDRETLQPAASKAEAVVDGMKNRHILLSVDGPLHNVIKIKPPMVFSRANADLLLEGLESVFGTL